MAKRKSKKNKNSLIGIIIALVAVIAVVGGGIGVSDNVVVTDEFTDTQPAWETFADTGNRNDITDDYILPTESQSYSDTTASVPRASEENKTDFISGDKSQQLSDKLSDVINSIDKNNGATNGQGKVTSANIPTYSGKAYAVINNNNPAFDESQLTTEYFESYDILDSYGRCGKAFACLGKETMPTEERGAIGSVKPSGWHTVKYDCVDGKYLYNRCHLIGFQLSGENANKRNLITGTRYMNTQGMLPFENMVSDYIEETGNHVMYRVTPVFVGDELVARGVQMEAYSVEDEGDGICFNVFCFNVQPGVVIDYATGESELE